MGDIWQSAGACSGFEFQPIGGRWRAGRFIRNLLNTNPLIGQALVEMTLMSARDVAEAYQSASAALYKTGQGFDARREEIIPWLIDEVSSSRLKASIAGQSARGVMLDAASFPYRVVGRILNVDIAGKEYQIYCRPLSMIDISTLWTSSLHLIQRSLASVQGNAAVAKPAGDMSVGGVLVLGEIFVEVGRWAFFIGRVAWAEISAITLLGIRYSHISFTGSAPAGRGIGRVTAVPDVFCIRGGFISASIASLPVSVRMTSLLSVASCVSAV